MKKQIVEGGVCTWASQFYGMYYENSRCDTCADGGDFVCDCVLTIISSSFSGENCTNDGSVRIAGDGLEGHVEYCANGRWGTVCSNNWDALDAMVVCRELGHNTLGMDLIMNG